MQNATTDHWFELNIACDPESVEVVTGVFTHYGFTQGVTVQESFARVDDGDEFAVAPRDLVQVSTVLRAADVGPEAFAEARRSLWLARQALWIKSRSRPIGALHVLERCGDDGAVAREGQPNALRVGNQVVVKVPGYDLVAMPGETVIEIDAGIAFGTGRHLSTQLCMQALENEMAVGASVLDVGTGSGLLAITAALLGARTVDAMDIDPAAVRVAQANAERNSVGGSVRIALGTVGPGCPFPGPFDLVIANIIAGVLIELASDLAGAVAPGGTLIIGGIIDDKEFLVHEAFAHEHLVLARRVQVEDWVALVWRKPRT
ncbi:MAG: 50S ribosomal protein L11 methyltransferase [Thermomicrobiales bacterium]